MTDSVHRLIDFLYNTITLEMFLKFLVLYFFVIWISLLVWVVKDISNRTESILLQFLSILIILFLTPLGFFIYLIVRPSKTLLERCYEEIDYNLDVIAGFVEEHTKAQEHKKQPTKKKKVVVK